MSYPHSHGSAQVSPGPGPSPSHGGPPAKKPGPLVIAALVVGGVVALVAFGFFARFMAQRQDAECATAIGVAMSVVGGNDDAKASAAAERAHAKCRSGHESELAGLDQALARRAELAKTRTARPALLAAGYRAEQLDRATMAPVCKSRGFMVVEMVAPNVAGSPHYFDCDRLVLWQTSAQSREECAARKLEHTTTTDELGNTVGACKRTAPPEEETPPGLMRVKADGAYVGATTKAKLERAVAISASGDREAFARYMKTEPGVVVMQPRLEVFIVELDGLLFGPARVRKKGSTQEIWVLREALESP